MIVNLIGFFVLAVSVVFVAVAIWLDNPEDGS